MEKYPYKPANQLPLPPFGKILEAYIEEKIKLNIYITIYIGKEAKERAFYFKKLGELCCYLPYGQDYESYRWPVLDQKIIIEDTSLSSVIFLKKMCSYIFFQQNAACVYLHSDSIPARETIHFYRPEIYTASDSHNEKYQLEKPSA